jgi:hypothetical protein
MFLSGHAENRAKTISLATVLTIALFGASFAFANPATLPKHPDYPVGKAGDPAGGQSLSCSCERSGPTQFGRRQGLHEAAAETAPGRKNLSINQHN